MSRDAPRDLSFQSPQELRKICLQLGLILHSRNRTSMGESKFAWEMARALQQAGVAFDEKCNDKELNAAFGDGYSPGTLTKTERWDVMAELILGPRPAPE
ncbi:hypothetical protein IV417_11960 [Alphaproteobacteria bacterium KMM 3653]|uniref:Uncharacterized protein n=1 Tax=Harenicola maris TaxID=2841044 RepID=A0AAP2CQ82_9RHOB|nr:hypothetical protein [Harenicola maris]